MVLDARIATEAQLQQMVNNSVRKMYKRVPFVYAHGQLEEDLGTDIIYLFEGDYHLRNGLVAYTTNLEPVCFHLYKHPRTLELTGIVTYCRKDKESYEFGKKLVEARPDRF